MLAHFIRLSSTFNKCHRRYYLLSLVWHLWKLIKYRFQLIFSLICMNGESLQDCGIYFTGTHLYYGQKHGFLYFESFFIKFPFLKNMPKNISKGLVWWTDLHKWLCQTLTRLRWCCTNLISLYETLDIITFVT